AGRRRVLGPHHPFTAETMAYLSQLLLLERQYTGAESQSRETLQILEKISPNSWWRYYSQSLLGAALAAQKRYGEAEPLLVSGYTGMVQRKATIPSPNRQNLVDAGVRVAELYRAWGRLDQANAWQS